MHKVFVTGMGVISSLGVGKEANLDRLCSGKGGIGRASVFESKYTGSLFFGEVNLSDDVLKELTENQGSTDLSSTALLAFFDAEEAFKQACLSNEDLSSYRTGIISSSTVGGMCNTVSLYNDANRKDKPSTFIGSYADAEHTLQLIKRYGIKGYSSTINTACSSSANAIMLGARLIRSGRLDRVIVGGSDALAKYTVNGFNAMMILSDEPCTPFDANRKGLTLGEGAGYMVLESEKVVGKKNLLAEVVGYGNASDAYHPSTTSPDSIGPTLAMQKALKLGEIKADEIDYINTHGTGTVNNDETELIGISNIFGQPPIFNSTKSYTGHTLSAAGVIESIYCIFSLLFNEVYPSLRIKQPMEGFAANDAYLSGIEIEHAMSNSFGFGGNCTSIKFKKV